MEPYYTNAYATEQASLAHNIRRNELKDQCWNRAKSQLIADSENILLTDAHWAVLKYLRNNYQTSGLPRHARYLSESIDDGFSTEGGNKYLRKLFPGGVITQGSRFANLPAPADSLDASHGFCY